MAENSFQLFLLSCFVFLFSVTGFFAALAVCVPHFDSLLWPLSLHSTYRPAEHMFTSISDDDINFFCFFSLNLFSVHSYSNAHYCNRF
jgi:hypothetical protein